MFKQTKFEAAPNKTKSNNQVKDYLSLLNITEEEILIAINHILIKTNTQQMTLIWEILAKHLEN